MGPAHPEAVMVLAAGEGRRMCSQTPKVLHRIGGRSLLGHAMAAARGLRPAHLVVVVRHGREAVAGHVAEVDPAALVADQDEVKGTGRAVACGLTALPEGLTGTIVVTYGDVPLLGTETLTDLLAHHHEQRAAVTVLTAVVPDPTGYGRILRAADGQVEAIVEHRDADAAQRAVTEINSGVYAFDLEVLRWALAGIGQDNAQGEVYLTDVVALARAKGERVVARTVDDLWQVEGVNDRVQLAALGAELNRRTVRRCMLAGAGVVDPATTWIDVDVDLAPDTTVLPGTQLLAGTTVAAGATVGPDTTLSGCTVGAGATVTRTHAVGARIGPRAEVGPFTYLRPGTVLGERAKAGGFVETKNAVIGAGSKVPHLSYVGDAEIGERTNLGAATVVVNYDGVAKHRTRIGDDVRIGSDSMLVAPVTVGDGAYTAAGSVITQDVPPGALGIARGVQRNVGEWVLRRRAGTASAEAARAALAGHAPSGDAGTSPRAPGSGTPGAQPDDASQGAPSGSPTTT